LLIHTPSPSLLVSFFTTPDFPSHWRHFIPTFLFCGGSFGPQEIFSPFPLYFTPPQSPPFEVSPLQLCPRFFSQTFLFCADFCQIKCRCHPGSKSHSFVVESLCPTCVVHFHGFGADSLSPFFFDFQLYAFQRPIYTSDRSCGSVIFFVWQYTIYVSSCPSPGAGLRLLRSVSPFRTDTFSPGGYPLGAPLRWPLFKPLANPPSVFDDLTPLHLS